MNGKSIALRPQRESSGSSHARDAARLRSRLERPARPSRFGASQIGAL